MESRKRTLAKAICWQISGLIMMILIGYVFTGSASQSGAIAIVGTVVGFLSYILHERIWARIGWGRAQFSHEPGSPDQSLLGTTS